MILAQRPVQNRHQELFWEIYPKDNPTKKHYLFGSYQSNDRRIFDLPDSLFWAIKNSTVLLVERNFLHDMVDVDPRIKKTKLNFDQYGNPYSSNTQSSQTLFGNESGMPQFLDVFIWEMFRNKGKKTIELNQETLTEFWNSLRNYKKNIFLAFNKEYRQNQLLELYLAKDIKQLDRFLKTYLSKKDSSYFDLVERRAINLTKSIHTSFDSGETTLAVLGVQYFGGANGIIATLRRYGYVLRPIGWNYTENQASIKEEMLSSQQYPYQDTLSNLHVLFDGIPSIQYRLDESKKIQYKELGQGNSYEVEILKKDTTLSEEQIASLHIQSPLNATFKKSFLDDGTLYFEGISDSYPEGYSWVRILFKDSHYAVCKAYGGNRFMNSQRPFSFFNGIWFE